MVINVLSTTANNSSVYIKIQLDVIWFVISFYSFITQNLGWDCTKNCSLTGGEKTEFFEKVLELNHLSLKTLTV